MTADEAARHRIGHGLDRTLFVDAGAGSGKTTSLVERIVNLVLVDGIRLADIAAITFTEAAAAELQDRVRVEFEERGAAAAPGSTDGERCRQAIADADLAAITTLHGFARRILAEHPVAAGLPPAIEIVDEVSSELASEDRWYRFVERLDQSPEHEELMLRAAAADAALEPRYAGHATMKDVAVELAQAWDRIGPVAEQTHPPLTPIDFGPFDRAVESLRAGLAGCTDAADKHLRHVEDTLLPALDAIGAIADPYRRLQMMTERHRPKVGPGNGGRKGVWDDFDSAKQRTRDVDAAMTAVTRTVADDVLRRLLTLVSREVLEAADQRRRDGRLEFHDLLVLARSMLRSSPETRRTLHQRYRRILLDEFQDTDPIQIELAVLIASGDREVPAHWSQVEVDAGRLFFVGDPKQSIYRFRGADIELFLEARERFGADGGRCSLTTNFRTVAPILEWVNHLFGGLMGDGEARSQPAYEALVPHRIEVPDGADLRPVLLGHGHADLRAGELRELEAAEVRRAVTAIRDDPQAWPVFDTTDRTWRNARLSDVTILLPTRTSLPYLRDALDQGGIPYRLDTGTLVYDSQEVRDVLAVLRAVDDPTDERSLVAALRSPLYACSDADLFTFVDAGGRWDTAHPIPDTVPDDHPVRRGIDHLRTMADQRWWLGPSDLLGRVLAERHAFLLGFGATRPADVWRRLRFLHDQARMFEESAGGGIREFLDWAGLHQSGSAAVHEPLLPETDNTAVRIMTIHGAKGLEFPITILSGMTTKPATPRSGVKLLWDGDVPAVRMPGGVATDNHDARADLEEAMDVHEKLRLLYVGCTRARDHLLVSCTHKHGDGSYASRIWIDADPDRSRALPPAAAGPAAPEPAPAPPPPPPPAYDGREWAAARDAVLESNRVRRVVSATAVARLLADPPGLGEVTEDVEDADDDRADQPVPEPLDTSGHGRAGSAVGRAVHACLELIDLRDPVDLAVLASAQAANEHVPDLADVVSSLVSAALASDAARLAGAHRHHKEVFVAAPIGDRAIEGYVDLVIETDDGLVVVDWKTDRVEDADALQRAVERHTPQGAAYAIALEAATGVPVREVRFVFCTPRGPVEHTVPDLVEATGHVRSALVQPD